MNAKLFVSTQMDVLPKYRIWKHSNAEARFKDQIINLINSGIIRAK